MKKTLIAAAAVTALLPILASAQFAKTEDAIRYRQSALFLMGQHFGRIGNMVNNKAPFDAAEAKRSADILNVVAHLPWAAFGAGTDKGGNTKAKPEIWLDPDKFSAAQKRMEATLPKLQAAAATGDQAAIKTAVGETASACKNCHDDFRAK